MANQKISQMPAITAAELAASDLLAVVDVSDVSQASSGSNKKITVSDLQSAAVSSGTANGVLYLNGSKVATSGSALTFDGYGNLGLGVTLSAWSGGNKALQIGDSAHLSGVTALTLGTNYSYNAADYYVQSGYASKYVSYGGQHQWYTAPSGTAGQPISFTQAMTLDPSGRLYVGPTSAADVGSARFAVTGGAAYAGDFYLTAQLTSDVTTAGKGVLIGYNNASNTGIIASAYGNGTESLAFWTHNSAAWGERARIDSSGNLLVGTTSAGYQNANSCSLEYSGYSVISHAAGSSSGNLYVAFGYAGNGIGSITQNGTTAVSYNTSSDYRLKNIAGPITNSGAYIDSLNPVEGTWKADGSTFVGLIAHEVQEVSRTQVATGEKDGAEMQAMDYSNSELIANLIAEVKSLRARVAALESN